MPKGNNSRGGRDATINAKNGTTNDSGINYSTIASKLCNM